MRPVLSRQQLRDFDARATQAGVPGIVLMENAGRGAAHLIGLKIKPRLASEVPPSPVRGSCVRCADERSLAGSEVTIVCGSGNNGGDGYVVARHLLGRGCDVSVLVVSEPAKVEGDAKVALEAARAVGLPIEFVADGRLTSRLRGVVVDALLGTGLSSEVKGSKKEAIEHINHSGARVFSLDVPSGLDAQTGAVLGEAVRAEHTVTFAHLKPGLLTSAGLDHAGRITVSHIGVPSALPPEEVPAGQLLEVEDIAARLEARPRSAHKGSSGRVVAVAGTAGTLGAARLVAHAALRSGAGLVTVASSQAAVERFDHDSREVMSHAIEPGQPAPQLLTGADALVIGPGLGKSQLSSEMVRLALECKRPSVLDADGLNVLEDLAMLREHPAVVLTPHPGEAARLLDCSVTDIENDRFAAARRISDASRSTVVLKGPCTLIARPGWPIRVSAMGTTALAVGGAGDTLSGLLGTALAHELKRRGDSWQEQGADLAFEAATLAVGIHGLAAERWSRNHGDRGLLASEIADEVPALVAELLGADH